MCTANTTDLSQCQSTNHAKADCYGEIWECSKCHKKVCYQEGTTEDPELCDDCWAVKHKNDDVKGEITKLDDMITDLGLARDPKEKDLKAIREVLWNHLTPEEKQKYEEDGNQFLTPEERYFYNKNNENE